MDATNPDEADIYLLFVLEQVPNTIVEEVLRKNHDETGGHFLRLADDSINHDSVGKQGTQCPLDPKWQSPFLGKSAQDVAEIVRTAPKTFNRAHFAVLDPEGYGRNNTVTVYKIVNGEAQGIPCTAREVSTFLLGYDGDTWEESWRSWREEGLGL